MIALIVAALVAAASGHGVVPPLDPAIVDRVQDATVLVRTRYGLGTGFVVLASEGRLFVVTNHHVIAPPPGKQPPDRIEVLFGMGLRSARWPIEAQVVAWDPKADLAVLSIPLPEGAPAPLRVARSCDDLAGAPVYAAGHPYGATVNLSPGRISPDATTPGLIVLDLGLNPGNSGGPVVTTDGAVVGVAVANVRRTETSFAIPCTAIRQLFRGSPAFEASLREVTPDAALAARDPASAAVGPELREGLAFLVGSGGRGTGFLVARRGDELLFATADVDMFRVTVGDKLSATLSGDTAPRRARMVKVEDGVALVSVPAAGRRARPFTISHRLPRETEPVRVLGFDPVALESDFAVVLEPANVTAIRVGADAHFQVDMGVEGGIMGGPVVDADGKVIGAARKRRPGTNVSVAAFGVKIRRILEQACADAPGACDREPGLLVAPSPEPRPRAPVPERARVRTPVPDRPRGNPSPGEGARRATTVVEPPVGSIALVERGGLRGTGSSSGRRESISSSPRSTWTSSGCRRGRWRARRSAGTRRHARRGCSTSRLAWRS